MSNIQSLLSLQRQLGGTSNNTRHDPFISASFAGDPSPLLSKTNLHRHISGDLSQISYSGYLLKRSNQPYQQQSSTFSIDATDVPALPMMQGTLASKNLEDQWAPNEFDSSSETVSSAPLYESLVTPCPPHSLTAEEDKPTIETTDANNPIQRGLESAAAFFGVSLGAMETQHQSPQPIQSSLHTEAQSTPKKKASAPIKVENGTSLSNYRPEQSQRDSFEESVHRRHSAPVLMTPNTHGDLETPSQSWSKPPDDFIDPQDGHLWRAKYCVLEEGALYFYRNTNDGESAEAVRERRQASLLTEGNLGSQTQMTASANDDLSKSPMARGLYQHLDAQGREESLPGYMWEKRVLLNCVGAVRSAEQEYRPHSFELQGINADDPLEYVDALVLQARNHRDMNEWIFQFHRSLASFMRNIIDVVGSRGAYLNVDHPALSHPHSNALHNSSSERQLQRLLAISPKFSQTPPQSNSLSHGHGRTTFHRRRRDAVRNKSDNLQPQNGISSLLSATKTGGSGSTQLAMWDPPPGSKLCLSSSSGSPPDRFLLPPMNKPESHAQASRPQQSYREGEQKKLSTSADYMSPKLRTKQHQSREVAPPKKYIPPHLRKKQEQHNTSMPYIPPHMRNSEDAGKDQSLLSLEQREETCPQSSGQSTTTAKENNLAPSIPSAMNGGVSSLDIVGEHSPLFTRGGCADPQLIKGSILDPTYIPKKASRLGRGPSKAFGSYGGSDLEGFSKSSSSLRWETGAVSECGIRDSNEDAYLIAHDLLEAFRSLPQQHRTNPSKPKWTKEEAIHNLGLFAVFDGHCGNQAARFAAEKLVYFINKGVLAEFPGLQGKLEQQQSSAFDPAYVEHVLCNAITRLDDEFCCLCQEKGREWESGATALIAMIVNEHLVIANVGDCRGVLCRVVEDKNIYAASADWNELDEVIDDFGQRSNGVGNTEMQCCFWKEATVIHNPSNKEESDRIEKANGWVTTETEIPIGQLHRMDFLDEDVIGILKRCFNDRYEDSGRSVRECKAAPQRILQISRVCGELAVSRALGDRDFKSAFNTPEVGDTNGSQWWDCPLFLTYPDLHSRRFQGDLVSNSPDFQKIRLGGDGVSDEFLVLACDGLWDVMDADDAVRVTRDLLFRKKWTAKRAAARLAELAIHLGSSDNVTVLVIRIFNRLAKATSNSGKKKTPIHS